MVQSINAKCSTNYHRFIKCFMAEGDLGFNDGPNFYPNCDAGLLNKTNTNEKKMLSWYR